MLGLVTIGQSPRDDVMASMFDVAHHPCVIQSGALDLLDHATIAGLEPSGDEHPLVTRLRDGREVVVAKPRLLPYLSEAVLRLEDQGATVICILCTGEFPALGSRAMILYPDRILSHTLEAILPEGRVGVLMPHEGQREMMVRKWATDCRSVATGTASPYSAADEIAEVARRLADDGAQAIVMDCMGFDRRMVADARAAVDVPVILANSLVGAVVRQLIDLETGDVQLRRGSRADLSRSGRAAR